MGRTGGDAGSENVQDVVAKEDPRPLDNNPATALGETRFNRSSKNLPGQTDKSGQPVAVVSKTLADMERTPSVKDVTDSYRERGLAHVLDTVQDWYTSTSKVDWSGAFTTLDGRTAMVLPIRTLLFPSMVEQTVHHELGHAVDLIEAGGLFSGMPEFNLRIVGDTVRAHGDVASELVAHYETDPTSQMGSLLKYPLDRSKYNDLNAQAIREELFAQVWSVWSTPTGRDFITDNLPDTAHFMEKVDEEIRQDEYRAKVVALTANGRAPQATDGTVRFGEGQAVLPSAATRDAGGGQPVLPGGQVTGIRFNRTKPLATSPSKSAVQKAVATLPRRAQKPVNTSSPTHARFAFSVSSRAVSIPALNSSVRLVITL